MYIGYNTNGFVHHRLEDAIEVMAELGYEGVGITLDHHALNPFEPGFEQQRDEIRALLKRLRMRCVLETGAKFILDARRKHQPTLLSPDSAERRGRVDYYERSIQLGAALEADAVSLWSGGSLTNEPADVLFDRLVEGCQEVCDYAARYGVRMAFEPEPDMFVETMEQFEKLSARVNRPMFGLALDVGHAHCVGDAVVPAIERWKDAICDIHIEDMRRGVHSHLMFGQGEMNFAEILGSLTAVNYRGGVFVELSAHSSDAVETARKALAYLASVEA